MRWNCASLTSCIADTEPRTSRRLFTLGLDVEDAQFFLIVQAVKRLLPLLALVSADEPVEEPARDGGSV